MEISTCELLVARYDLVQASGTWDMINILTRLTEPLLELFELRFIDWLDLDLFWLICFLD